MKSHLSQSIVRCSLCALLCWSASSQVLNAQQAGAFGGNNRPEIGAALLNICDLNHDGQVTLPELKEVADASFKLWDTNNVGSLSQSQLSSILQQFYPAPPPGVGGTRIINGVAVVPLPQQLAQQLFANADSNKDGLLTLQELNDFLERFFGQWDLDGNGSLNAQELGAAYRKFVMPDDPVQAGRFGGN